MSDIPSNPESTPEQPAEPTNPTPPESPQPTVATPTYTAAASSTDSTAALIWILTIFLGFIPGLIFFLTANDRPFVKRHAGMALGWSIVVVLLHIARAFIHIPMFGTFAIWALSLVVCILGLQAANKGEAFDVPVVGKFIADTLKL